MRFRKYIFVVAAVISAFTVTSGCASTRIKHVGAAEFIQRAGRAELPASLGKTSYIGVSDNRAYIEEQYFAAKRSLITRRPLTRVVWTELEDLPEELAEELKAGNPPWTPWQENHLP